MKNPIEIFKKEWALHSEMHVKIGKLRKKFDKEMDERPTMWPRPSAE